MRCLSLLAFLLLLAGCSSTEQSHLPPPPVNLTYHPDLQALPVESMDDIFNLNSDMKAQLNRLRFVLMIWRNQTLNYVPTQ